MTTQKQTQAQPQRARWFEAAGGLHSIFQSAYVLILLIAALVIWCVRVEIQAARNEDRFAAIGEKQDAGKQDAAAVRSELQQIHEALNRMEPKVDYLWKKGLR